MPKHLNVGCKNRPPYQDTYVMKPGLNDLGQQTGKVMQNRMTKSCMYDNKLTEPGCQGCWWQTNLDPRDQVQPKS